MQHRKTGLWSGRKETAQIRKICRKEEEEKNGQVTAGGEESY